MKPKDVVLRLLDLDIKQHFHNAERLFIAQLGDFAVSDLGCLAPNKSQLGALLINI